MHAYTPFGQEFYQPILDFQIKNLEKYHNRTNAPEFNHLYLIEDDNWKLEPPKVDYPITILHVNSSLRYYDAYKTVLPEIKEDLILLMDDDMILYQFDEEFWGPINETFVQIERGNADVVSITDTIGTMKVPLKTGNKLCPYFFATRKELLIKYLDVDWGPDAMPYTETFGLLTEAMLKDDCKVYEMEDDKTEVESWNPLETGKTLGYYHVRAGSTVAMLLATKHYGNEETYWEYLRTQPSTELIRHCGWYEYMGGNSQEIIEDLRKFE